MRQTTATNPIDMARQHTSDDRRAADDARRMRLDDETRITDGIEATRIRRLARLLGAPLHGGAPGATRTA
jgi:hypothetical protein